MSQDDRRSACLRKAIELCRLIAPEPLTLDEIAERLGWTTRTARRYIYALRRAGLDIVKLTPADDVEVDRADVGPAHRYQLDRRAWVGLLSLPGD